MGTGPGVEHVMELWGSGLRGQLRYGLKAIPIQLSATSLLLPCHIQLPPNWTAPQCSPPGTKPSLMTTAHGQAGLQ